MSADTQGPTASLTPQQVTAYFAQGYLLLEGLIPAARLQVYNQRFLQFVQGEAALAPAMKIMRDVMVVKGVVAPETPVHGVNKLLCLENDPQLFAYASEPALVAAVRALLGREMGREIYSLSSNVFNKPPGVDGRHPMHQDLRYFRLRPPEKIVGVWTAILPASRRHGCLAVIPGSHRQGMLEHANPDWEYVNHGFYGVGEVALERRVHMEMQPGDTLFLHPLLLHGSGANKSDAFRRAISVHYAAGDAESDKPDWQRRGLTRRVA